MSRMLLVAASWALGAIGVIVIAGCASDAVAPGPGSDVGAETLALTPAEQLEFGAAVDAAFCYCEAWALPTQRPSLGDGDAECSNGELSGYVARREASSLTPSQYCATRVAASAHGSFPVQLSQNTSQLQARTACAVNVRVGAGRTVAGQAALPGFCRPDIAYCAGNELSLRAASFARAPSSRAVRNALLDAARRQLMNAAAEYTQTLNYLATLCVGGTPASEPGRTFCPRMSPTYGPLYMQRVSDAIASSASLMETRTESAIAESDGLAPGATATGSFAEEVWGPGGARMAAAQQVLGSPLALFGPVPGLAGPGTGAMPYAINWNEDDRAQQALELLVTYESPTSHESCYSSAADELLSSEWRPINAERDFNVLDAAIVASRNLAVGITPPPPLPVPEEPISPLSASPLRAGLSLTPDHVRRAEALLQDLTATTELDVVFERVATTRTTATGGRICYRDRIVLRSSTPLPRSPAVLVERLGRAGQLLGIVRAAAIAPDPPVACPETAGVGSWYGYEPRHLAVLGAAGSLNVTRANILLLSRRTISWVATNRQLLNDSVGIIDEYAGTGFYETAKQAEPGWKWSVYGNSLPPGQPVVTTSESDAFCARYGHAPGISPERSTCTPPVPLVLIGPVAATERGRPGMSYLLPPDVAIPLNRDIYILWRTTTEGHVQLLDVTRKDTELRGNVHVVGGRFGELVNELFAKSVKNPVLPARNSLGLASDLVPPLEHPLISDGDTFEDSFRYYLDYARNASVEAGSLIAEARAKEIEQLRSDEATAAALDSAGLAQEAVLADACGVTGPEESCDVPRAEPVSIFQLGLIADRSLFLTPGGAPAGPPRTPDGSPGGSVDCATVLANYRTAFRGITLDEPEQVPPMKAILVDALQCSRSLTLYVIGNTVLQNVPQRVIDEVRSGGDGTFADAAGQVRQEYIAMFSQIADLKDKLGDLEIEVETAQTNIELAMNDIRHRLDEDGPLGDAGCFFSTFGESLALIVGGVVALAGSPFTGGASGVAGVLLLIAAGASATGDILEGVNNLYTMNETCGDEEFAAQQSALAAFRDTTVAMHAVGSTVGDLRSAVLGLASGDERLRTLERQVEIAGRRRSIDARLAVASNPANQASWRALRGVEALRAREALRRAQRLAFVARRAVEFRLASNLPSMTRAEPFVAAPSTWVNSIFTLDTLTSEPAADDPFESGGTARVLIADQALGDYIRNLEDFVFGYPFERRFSAGSDLQVLNLGSIAGADGLDRPEIERIPLVRRLSFKCAGYPTLIEGGVLPGGGPIEPGGAAEFVPCSTRDGSDVRTVEYAAFSFAIPPALTGYFGERLSRSSYNYRISGVALNVVGTAVFDCTLSSRPAECYGDGNAFYSLRQSGAVSLENYERNVLAFATSPGVIENARGLVAERLLTNPLSSVDAALVGGYERSEFFGRPLVGRYTLTIWGRREIDWSRIQDVQMLLRYDYWTRQE